VFKNVVVYLLLSADPCM